MGYRWKPNASQRAEYAAKMREKEEMGATTTKYAIRVGCWLDFYSVSLGCRMEGTVITSSYGADRGQHTFTIQTADGQKLMVKGRNLYPNIFKHIQGEESKKTG